MPGFFSFINSKIYLHTYFFAQYVKLASGCLKLPMHYRKRRYQTLSFLFHNSKNLTSMVKNTTVKKQL